MQFFRKNRDCDCVLYLVLFHTDSFWLHKLAKIWFHVKFQWQKNSHLSTLCCKTWNIYLGGNERVFLVDDLVVHIWKWHFHDFLSNLFTLRRRNVEILLLTNNGDASISKIQIPFAFEGNSRKFELNSKRKWRKIGEEGEDLAWKCFYNAFFFFFFERLGHFYFVSAHCIFAIRKLFLF